MTNYWYVARQNELLVDIDHREGPPVKLGIMRARLLGAIKDEKLFVESAWLWPSTNPLHYHVFVILEYNISTEERLIWESRLMDDPYRNIMNRMRHIRNVVGSLLISSVEYPMPPRLPDYLCSCEGKHDASVMSLCNVAITLRGEDVITDYMGHPVRDDSPMEFGRII